MNSRHLASIFDFIAVNIKERTIEATRDAVLDLFSKIEELSTTNNFIERMNQDALSSLIKALRLIHRQVADFGDDLCFLKKTVNRLVRDIYRINPHNRQKIFSGLKNINVEGTIFEKLIRGLMPIVLSGTCSVRLLGTLRGFFVRQPELLRHLDFNALKEYQFETSSPINNKINLFSIAAISYLHKIDTDKSATVNDINDLLKDLSIEELAEFVPNAVKYIRSVRRILQAYDPENCPANLNEQIKKIQDLLNLLAKKLFSKDQFLSLHQIYMELKVIEYLVTKQDLPVARVFDIPPKIAELAKLNLQTGVTSITEKEVREIFLHEANRRGIHNVYLKPLNGNEILDYGGFAIDIRVVNSAHKEFHIEVDGYAHDANSSIPDYLRDKYFEESLNIPVFRINIGVNYDAEDVLKQLDESGIYDLL